MVKIQWGKILTSKTLWLNVIAVVIFIIQSLQGKAWLPAEYQAIILGVLNMIVRFLTNDSLTTASTTPTATATTSSQTTTAPADTQTGK